MPEVLVIKDQDSNNMGNPESIVRICSTLMAQRFSTEADQDTDHIAFVSKRLFYTIYNNKRRPRDNLLQAALAQNGIEARVEFIASIKGKVYHDLCPQVNWTRIGDDYTNEEPYTLYRIINQQ